jgi:hypothetical protein
VANRVTSYDEIQMPVVEEDLRREAGARGKALDCELRSATRAEARCRFARKSKDDVVARVAKAKAPVRNAARKFRDTGMIEAEPCNCRGNRHLDLCRPDPAHAGPAPLRRQLCQPAMASKA